MPREISPEKKEALLKYLEDSTERKTAAAFGVSKSCVNRIKNMRLAYLEKNNMRNLKLLKKVRNSGNGDVNRATLLWFNRMRDLNNRVTNEAITEVALRFAKEFQVVDFKASSGWLHCFKKRNMIFQKESSVPRSCDSAIVVDDDNDCCIVEDDSAIVCGGELVKLGELDETCDESMVSSDDDEDDDAASSDDAAGSDVTIIEAIDMLKKLKGFAVRNNVGIMKYLRSAECCLSEHLITKQSEAPPLLDLTQ